MPKKPRPKVFETVFGDDSEDLDSIVSQRIEEGDMFPIGNVDHRLHAQCLIHLPTVIAIVKQAAKKAA